MPTAPTAATPRSRRTRVKLIDATAQVAVTHGLRALTVEHILAAASLSRRTFYQHFCSKDDALLALYERVVDDLLGAVVAAVRAADGPGQRLFAGLDAYLDFQQGGGDLVTLLQAEAANPASLLSPLRERALDALVELVDTEVREEIGEALDPMVYRTLYLGLEALVIHLRSGGPLSRADRARAAAIIKPLFVQVFAAMAHMPRAERE